MIRKNGFDSWIFAINRHWMPEMIHNYWIFAIMFVGTLKIRRRLRTLQRLTELAALTAIILRHSPTLTELRSVIFASLRLCIFASLHLYAVTPLRLWVLATSVLCASFTSRASSALFAAACRKHFAAVRRRNKHAPEFYTWPAYLGSMPAPLARS